MASWLPNFSYAFADAARPAGAPYPVSEPGECLWLMNSGDGLELLEAGIWITVTAIQLQFLPMLKKILVELISPNPKLRRTIGLVVIALVLAIGFADFLLGFEISLLFFYFLPISLAVASLGWRLGAVTAIASVSLWLCGDIAAGAHFPNTIVPLWNASIALGTYLLFVGLVATLASLHREMENRVRQRTSALTEQIAERERLEKEILEMSERERRAIGRDLHDGICQHLAGTALAGEVVSGRLEARNVPEATDVRRLVNLVEQAIDQTRNLAKGLLLAPIEEDGLFAALHEFASNCEALFAIKCKFTFDKQIRIKESAAASHLFRITQEAVRNAVRHGGAKNIAVSLTLEDETVVLAILDDGSGLPQEENRSDGMGLRIMAHRAEMIGGKFSVERAEEKGTLVVCTLPA